MNTYGVRTWDSILPDTWDAIWAPIPNKTVDEWADENRRLAANSSAEPGPYRTSRTPYLREVMRLLSSTSPVERVVLMASAQVGKSECGNNFVGTVMDLYRGPIILVQPTVELVERYSRQRIATMINSTPALAAKIKPARSRDGGNTLLSKEFPGGILVMTGANSAVGLRSMPAQRGFGDEIDGWPDDVDGEGDPIQLLENRTNTFGRRRKIFLTSTPTIKGKSKIEAEYLSSDQRRYFVPCPHCLKLDWLRWENVRWTAGKPQTAHMVCSQCAEPILEHHKRDMLAGGEWRPTADGDGLTVGFHISALYSPWYEWHRAVAGYEKAKRAGSQSMKAWTNTVLGEAYEEEGDAPKAEQILLQVKTHQLFPRAVIPPGFILIVGAVDVQGDRLEWSIYTFNRNMDQYLLARDIISGPPEGKEVWTKLEKVMDKQWSDVWGRKWPVQSWGIDAGFLSQQVYRFVQSHASSGRVLALDGRHGWKLPPIGTPQAKEVDYDGQKIGTVHLWPVGTWDLKSEVYHAVRLTIAGPDPHSKRYKEGAYYAPEDLVDLEFFTQLCAEYLQIRIIKGQPVQEWVKGRHRNEQLDLAVYCRGLARHAANLMSEEDWSAVEFERLGNWSSLPEASRLMWRPLVDDLPEAQPVFVQPPVEVLPEDAEPEQPRRRLPRHMRSRSEAYDRDDDYWRGRN